MVEQIVIVGTGRLPAACLERCLAHGRKLVCIEPEHQAFSPFKAASRRSNVEYRLLTEKDALKRFFLEIAVPTLVVSAYNGYLFPGSVLENPHLSIVNFHNSLLPRHRGRNAPTWAIFELDQETGITWHRITKKIDSGEIIAQQPILIGDRVTALELTLRTLEVGADVFGRIIPPLIRGECPGTRLAPQEDGVLHRAKDIPNDGVLDLGWGTRKMSAFLRSMDYGKFKVFPDPRVILEGIACSIGGYQVTPDSRLIDNKLTISDKFLIAHGEGLALEVMLRREEGHDKHEEHC
jgi:methionyl-tRNA formyltransferase